MCVCVCVGGGGGGVSVNIPNVITSQSPNQILPSEILQTANYYVDT